MQASSSKNQHFYHFDHTQEEVNEILRKVKPKLIISAIRGPFDDQIDLHQQLVEHCKYFDCRLMFLSSSNVYDAFHNYPSTSLIKPCQKVSMAD